MLSDILQREFAGNTLELYLQAALIIVVGLVALLIIGKILKKRIEKIENRENKPVGKSIGVLRFTHRIVLPLMFLGLLAIGSSLLEFDENIRRIVQGVLAAIMTVVVVRSINKAVELSFLRYFEKEAVNHEHEKNLRPLLSLIKFVFWVIGLIFLLANLGFDVSTAVAGLGVSGIAVAIAAQGILGDLFSYFVIFFDKPFELGDFIIFGDKLGFVEKIGIKSSRIRMLSGELLVVSNSDLTSSRIHNYKQMKRRRIAFKIGVTYETKQEHVEEIPSIIRSVIESVESAEGVICDRSHFQSFGNFSLDFETVYYVPTPDYNVYMDVQQEINRKLFRIFNEKQIDFAYPTQMIHMYGRVEQEDKTPQSQVEG
ncbi:MAG: mechanosensitive ion channel family protein [Spirochaetota bacterium]